MIYQNNLINMPTENSDNRPDHDVFPTNGWKQLAHDAANNWDLEHPGVRGLYENHVVHKLQDNDLGHLAITAEDRAGGRLLHKYGTLNPEEINHVITYLRSSGETVPDKAGDRTAAYLKFMADTVDDGILTGSPESVKRQIDSHVIRAEDVPESYFALQRRIAREQGHGDIEVTADKRSRLTKIIQADQRNSLKQWAVYLGGDSTIYPDWFKRYTFDNVLKMGGFDPDKDRYEDRDTTTVAPYPELNRGSLSYVYSWIKQLHVDGTMPQGVFEGEGNSRRKHAFEQALKSGSFKELLVHANHKVGEGIITESERTITDGVWKKYAHDSDPGVLHGDLQGFGLTWCTATGYDTTVAHLAGGDFYVFYTEGSDGKRVVPRVAVRIENGIVAEVRGIDGGRSQEVEPAMADVVADQLKDLPGGKEYVVKARDMKRLTVIDNLLIKDPNVKLSPDDIAFLYELDHDITGFGYDEYGNNNAHDPRIDEIKAKRGERDLPEITRLLYELLARQAESSYQGYTEIAKQLGAEPLSMQEFSELFDIKMAEWRENGVMEYIVRDFVDNGNKPILLATPNVIASWDDLRSAAVNFGKNQPYETRVYGDLYRHYSAEELSGVPIRGSVRFGVMPSGYTRSLGQAPVDTQRERLEQIQAEQPSLGMRVPSVLEAIAYWYALRAKDGSVAGFDKTYIRHFDLRPVRFGSWPVVPRSCVRGGGKPSLGNSGAEDDGDARVLVG